MIQRLETELPEFSDFELLGKGAFATVVTAIHRCTNRKIAIKVVEKSGINRNSDIFNARRESMIMSSLDHPFIVQTFDTFETEDYYAILLEFIPGPTLLQYINRHMVYSTKELEKDNDKSDTCTDFEESEIQRIFIQILAAVSYMHSHSIIHRDLKLENILLLENIVAKVIDFGFSKNLNEDPHLSATSLPSIPEDSVDHHEFLQNTFCGSVLYSAPELFLRQDYGKEVDVWSLGIILYCLRKGSFPFSHQSTTKIVDMIINNDYIPPENSSDEYLDLLSKLLQKDKTKRITIPELLHHPFISESEYYKFITTTNNHHNNFVDLHGFIKDQHYSISSLPDQLSLSSTLSHMHVFPSTIDDVDFNTLCEIHYSFEDNVQDDIFTSLRDEHNFFVDMSKTGDFSQPFTYKLTSKSASHDEIREIEKFHQTILAYKIVRTEKVQRMELKHEAKYQNRIRSSNHRVAFDQHFDHNTAAIGKATSVSSKMPQCQGMKSMFPGSFNQHTILNPSARIHSTLCCNSIGHRPTETHNTHMKRLLLTRAKSVNINAIGQSQNVSHPCDPFTDGHSNELSHTANHVFDKINLHFQQKHSPLNHKNNMTFSSPLHTRKILNKGKNFKIRLRTYNGDEFDETPISCNDDPTCGSP